MSLRKKIRKIINGDVAKKQANLYFDKFRRYSFIDCHCSSPEQFEASIIRLYHTIEKGLSFQNYRAGFGKENIEKLIKSIKQYASKGFDTTTFFYETALSCLREYIKKNKEYGYEDIQLEKEVQKLIGKANELGGTIIVSAPIHPESLSYVDLIKSRHSIRHFSDKPVDIKLIEEAIQLAQFTPSACNRQSWRTIIVSDREKINTILANQNGNKGFGQEFDKLLVVTADLRAQQRGRETYQAFIDGGMYAENLLNCLYVKGIGSVPLSAALTPKQETVVRETIKIHEAEIFIIFIGVGNYPEGDFLTTRSERKPARFEIV